MNSHYKIRCVLVEDMKPQQEVYAEIIKSHPNFELVNVYDRPVPLQELKNNNIRLIFQDDDIRGNPVAVGVAAALRGEGIYVIVLTQGQHEPTEQGSRFYSDVILTYQRKKDFDREMLDRIYNEIILNRIKQPSTPMNEYIIIEVIENEGRKEHKTSIKSIVGCTTDYCKKNYCNILLENGQKIETRMNLNEVLDKIKNNLSEGKKLFFQRINHSWIVNRFHINTFNSQHKCIHINHPHVKRPIDVSSKYCEISIVDIPLGGGIVEW